MSYTKFSKEVTKWLKANSLPCYGTANDSPEETKARLDAWMRGSKEVLRQWITEKRYRCLLYTSMAFARDGSGGEYHLLEDGSIGYYSSEGEAGRLAESMDDLFYLIVSCICWHDCCDTKQYVDSKTLEAVSYTHLAGGIRRGRR